MVTRLRGDDAAVDAAAVHVAHGGGGVGGAAELEEREGPRPARAARRRPVDVPDRAVPAGRDM